MSHTTDRLGPFSPCVDSSRNQLLPFIGESILLAVFDDIREASQPAQSKRRLVFRLPVDLESGFQSRFYFVERMSAFREILEKHIIPRNVSQFYVEDHTSCCGGRRICLFDEVLSFWVKTADLVLERPETHTADKAGVHSDRRRLLRIRKHFHDFFRQIWLGHWRLADHTEQHDERFVVLLHASWQRQV